MLEAFFDKTFPFSCPLLERGQIIKSHELTEFVASSWSSSSIERASCRRKIKLDKVRSDKSDKDTDHVLDVKVIQDNLPEVFAVPPKYYGLV